MTFGPEFSNYSNVEMKIVNYLIICVAVLPFGMIQLQRLVFPDGAADDTFPIMRKSKSSIQAMIYIIQFVESCGSAWLSVGILKKYVLVTTAKTALIKKFTT